MAKSNRISTAYGKYPGLINIFSEPIVANREPKGSDKYEIGQMWVYEGNNSVWVLTSFLNGDAVWRRCDNGNMKGYLSWFTRNDIAFTASINEGYYLTAPAGSDIFVQLPNASTIGDQIYLITSDLSAAGSSLNITQQAGQFVVRGNDTSTVGAGTHCVVNEPNQTQVIMQLICTEANTRWDIVNCNANTDID